MHDHILVQIRKCFQQLEHVPLHVDGGVDRKVGLLRKLENPPHVVIYVIHNHTDRIQLRVVHRQRHLGRHNIKELHDILVVCALQKSNLANRRHTYPIR